ncbi:MAG: hypothetical protein QGG40_15705, partial [Myxococcota bacterium]|nr:hypothetical protein [Myxococcota bacterium]
MRTGFLLHMTLLGVALATAGCAQTPRPAKDDAQQYADALERTHEDLDSALEACNQILNPGLAQDCALAVV